MGTILSYKYELTIAPNWNEILKRVLKEVKLASQFNKELPNLEQIEPYKSIEDDKNTLKKYAIYKSQIDCMPDIEQDYYAIGNCILKTRPKHFKFNSGLGFELLTKYGNPYEHAPCKSANSKNDLFGNSFRFVCFYHAQSNVRQIWSDYHQTFVDEEEVDGKLLAFSLEEMEEISHLYTEDILTEDIRCFLKESVHLTIRPHVIKIGGDIEISRICEGGLTISIAVPYCEARKKLDMLTEKHGWTDGYSKYRDLIIENIKKYLQTDFEKNGVKYDIELDNCDFATELFSVWMRFKFFG